MGLLATLLWRTLLRSPPTTSTTLSLTTTLALPSPPPRPLMALELRLAPTRWLSLTAGPRLSPTPLMMSMAMLLRSPTRESHSTLRHLLSRLLLLLLPMLQLLILLPMHQLLMLLPMPLLLMLLPTMPLSWPMLSLFMSRQNNKVIVKLNYFIFKLQQSLNPRK